MSRAPVLALSVVAAVCVSCHPAFGQAVISTRAGLVHFFEGNVYIAGKPLEARLGKFASIPEGADLRTEDGRAEVLLTPGVFLRVGKNSAIRMIATSLADARVEMLEGSAIVDSQEQNPGTSATLIYKGWTMHQAPKGLYRVDCAPPRVTAREGRLEIAAADGTPVKLEQGMELSFAAESTPEKAATGLSDALTTWADGRAESISTDNTIAANIQDPASMPTADLMPDGFTYFPMLGLSSLGSSYVNPLGSGPYQAGMYGMSSLYQVGFSSIYLPGYTYRPLLLGLPLGGGLHRYGFSPSGIGFPGGIGIPGSIGLPGSISRPGSPILHPPVSHGPVSHPVPVPHSGVHVGGHR
jgi:hypothetical protein